MANHLEIQEKLERIYRCLWEKVFPAEMEPVQTVELVELTQDTEDIRDGYKHERKIIRIVADEEEITAIRDAEEKNVKSLFQDLLFPKWITRLLHEMSHEYECKVVQGNPTPRGREVRLECQTQYPENDTEHGENFFTAVVEVSKALDLDPVALVKEHGL